MSADHESWAEPVRFEDDARRNVPSFPVSSLPTVLAAYAESIAGHFLCPIDIPAVVLTGVISGVIAGRTCLHLNDDWVEPANLYMLSVSSPSLHKSPIMKLALAPVEREDARLVEEWQKARAISEEDEPPSKDRRKTERPEPPPPRLLADDATSEYLVRLLASGPLLVAAAEGRPFELMGGLYRNKGEDGVDVYLKSWSEDPIRSGRVGTGDVHVRRPNLSICLAVQPAVVDKLARRDDFRGRGLIARFLASIPRVNVGFRNWDNAQPINPNSRADYEALADDLLSLSRRLDGDEPPAVGLTAAAEALFTHFRQEIESLQKPGGMLAEWHDIGGKFAGQAARLALTIHMAAHGKDGLRISMSEDTMGKALELARYFLIHTVATWSSSSEDEPTARVARWLAKKKRATVTTRDIHRAHQGVPIGTQWIDYEVRPAWVLDELPLTQKPQSRSRVPLAALRARLFRRIPIAICDAVAVARDYRDQVVEHHRRLTGSASSRLSGRTADGGICRGHSHAFYLPTPDLSTGRISELVVHIPGGDDGIEPEERDALLLVSTLWRDDRYPILVAPEEQSLNAMQEPALLWRSRTPYLPPLRSRDNRREGPDPAAQLTRDLQQECGVEPVVSAVSGPGGAGRVTSVRTHLYSGEGAGWRWTRRGAHWFEVRFPEPVVIRRPLGADAHFGLGRFEPG